MTHLQTTTEFDGDLGALILAALCCLPLGAFYYFSEKEEMWICPTCRETIRVNAARCRYCDEDLTGYGYEQSPPASRDHEEPNQDW